MSTLRMILLAGGALGLLALVYSFGAESIASALTRVTWWQFALICLVHSLNVVVDSYGWRYAIAHDRAPFHRLVAARCASDAVNAITVVAAVGGEATKAWLLQRDIEALWSAVRFATFFVPASLGTLEGAVGAAFGAFGFSPGAGLAFTLVRRASQAVWIGVGAVVLMAMRPAPAVAAEQPAPVASAVD